METNTFFLEAGFLDLWVKHRSLDLTPPEGLFTDPFSQELSFIEEETQDNNSDSNNNNSISNDFTTANIDPFIGGSAKSFQVNSIDVNDTSFAPPKSELQF